MLSTADLPLEFEYDRPIVQLPSAIRGMTSLAASFYQHPDRGLIREGLYADITVYSESQVRDLATYEEPHRYSEGIVHAIVNGRLALKDGKPTGVLAGRPLPRRSTVRD